MNNIQFEKLKYEEIENESLTVCPYYPSVNTGSFYCIRACTHSKKIDRENTILCSYKFFNKNNS